MDVIKFEVIKKLTQVNFKKQNLASLKDFFSNSPPSVFVGSKLRYPEMNVGILSPLQREDHAWVYDDVKYWAQENFRIEDVLKLRHGLLNSNFRTRATDARLSKKFLDIAKEVAVSSRSVDMEISLKKRVGLDRKKDKVLLSHGLRAPLQNARITENVKVHRAVDKVLNDELKSSQSISLLYKSNIDENAISKILSIGVLGLKKNKRLVPTRWSITATDDTLGKNILKRVKQHRIIDDYKLFLGEFLGNQYLILLFPHVFSFELFELYWPHSSWNPTTEMKVSTDFESFTPRKEYAFNTAGGYYATRLPIIEYLDSIRRQAAILVIRLETPSYWAGLGVWVVRESVRKALQNRTLSFDSYDEFVRSAENICLSKYKYNPENLLKHSRLLSQVKTQRNLHQWF